MTLLLLGLGHLVSAPIAEFTEGNGGSVLLWLGLIETVTGIVLGSSLQQKPIITSVDCPVKRAGGKIWSIK